MNNTTSKQHGSPSNCPTDGDVFMQMLEAMTEEELTDGLNEALESMTDEDYDSALIDAYLAALDRKAPMPEIPDTDTSFANFKNRLLQTFPAKTDIAVCPRRKVRSVWRVGLVAVLTAICLMGGMVVAQAAGVDVFGAIARWTDEVFSLGAIRSDGADDGTSAPALADNGVVNNNKTTYASLQEALDDYGITEFREPTWIPDGYRFEDVEVDSWPDNGSFIGLFAEYCNGTDFLHIKVEGYEGGANIQAEKTNASVETFLVDGLTVYLLENIGNNSAAWVTEHYECYISGTMEKSVLKQIVLSAYAQLQ